jgi:hypothetical protein
MGTVNKHRGSVRRKLGFPSEDIISNGLIDEYTGEILDELVTELNLSSQSWLVPRFILPVNAFDEMSPVNTANFGRVQFITTYKDGDPQFRSRYVEVVDEPMLVKYFGGGTPGPTGVLHSARAFALVYKDGQQFLRVAPIPQESSEYQVIYEPSVVRPGSPTDQVFRLPQFDSYVSDLVALKMLPDNTELNDDDYEKRETNLEKFIARGDNRFRRFKQSDRQSNNSRSRPFGAVRWQRGHGRSR